MIIVEINILNNETFLLTFLPELIRISTGK